MPKRITTSSRKGGVGQRHALASEIAAGLEDELIDPGEKSRALQQGVIATPIGIGRQG